MGVNRLKVDLRHFSNCFIEAEIMMEYRSLATLNQVHLANEFNAL